jgi:hypothetical protein
MLSCPSIWLCISCSVTPPVTRPQDQTLASEPPRFVLHFTPNSSSWLNRVERRLAEPTMKLIKCRQHRSVRALNAEIRDWIDTW